MIRYRNSNTGDVVERREPSLRLERLPNWERLAGDGERDGGAANAPGTGELAQSTVGRPSRSEPKAAWQEYARSVARDADEVDAIDGMTKEQLVERYGGGN
ncbi:hypothetical protein [Streptomyces antimycoticus]|uniref:hypothetical protein n=1 Tax=Streptomyces antimycoticus TaxID=68175 RepID=UPI0034069D24